MIDINSLQQFLEVASSETLSEAASRLHISQPALSKSMKKLEADLNVPLFTRRKNRLVLNDNGHYFKEKVAAFLQFEEAMIQDLKDFDDAHRSIHIGVSAPIILVMMRQFVKSIYPDNQISIDLINNDHMLVEGLKTDVYQLIVTHEPFSDFYCQVCGDEQLYLSVPRVHPLASKEDVTFEDIDGLTMLRMTDVGFWGDVVAKHMPQTKFLLVGERDMFANLVEASTLPSFTTDYFLNANQYFDHVNIPIEEDDAYALYYLCCLKSKRDYYHALFEQTSINTFKEFSFQSLDEFHM